MRWPETRFLAVAPGIPDGLRPNRKLNQTKAAFTGPIPPWKPDSSGYDYLEITPSIRRRREETPDMVTSFHPENRTCKYPWLRLQLHPRKSL